MKQVSPKLLLIFLKNIFKKNYISKPQVTTLLLISVTLASLLGIVYSIVSSLLLTNIKLAEEKNTYQSVQEVLQEYTKVADDLYYVNIGWSEWDTTYNFIQAPQGAYTNEALTEELFPNRRFDLAVAFNKSGKNIFAKEWDNTSKKTLPIPTLLEKQIYPENILVQYPNTGKGVSGIINLPKGIMLISSLPLVKYPNLAKQVGASNQAQFRDGFIRPRSFPLHQPMPSSSSDDVGLTQPP